MSDDEIRDRKRVETVLNDLRSGNINDRPVINEMVRFIDENINEFIKFVTPK